MHKELQWVFLYFYHTDKANACIHMAPVRFSPITFGAARRLYDFWPVEEDVIPELSEVMSHIGQYELDQGR